MHIGEFGALPSGIAQVLNEYLAWDFTRVQVRAVASTTGKGDRWAALRSLRCGLGIVASRLSRRPSAFVVHLSSGGSFVREGALIALAHRCGLPVAAHLHGSNFAVFAARQPRLVAAVLRRVYRVYVLTTETERIVHRALGADAQDRVVKVANGVAAPQRLHAKERLVVFAGEAGFRKGVDVLLAAWPSVSQRHPAWRLVIAGPVAPTLVMPPPDPSITMLGSVDRDKVHDLLSRASIAVLPSRFEALPMFLLESMAHRCAVVATPVGEVANLVAGCGVVVPVGDRDSLASVLTDLIGRPEVIARLGAAARARIDQRYSADAVAQLVEHEWQVLLDSEHATGGNKAGDAVSCGNPAARSV